MDSMEIDDSIYLHQDLTMRGLVTQVDFQRRKPPSRCVTVCLGLLCAALLAGNIGQFVYYEIFSRPASAEPSQTGYQQHGSYDASTADGKLFEAKLSNLTEEKGRLQQSNTALATERDEFNASFNNLRNERDRLQASYNTLKQESDQSQTSYNALQRSLEGLQSNYTSLKTNQGQLQIRYITLQREANQLQSTCNHMRTSLEVVQADHGNLAAKKDQLQREKDRLQNKYSRLAEVKDEFEKKINKMRGRPCQTGWRKWDVSCYSVSTEKKNWTMSREDCIARGSDLVDIESEDEQAFVNGLLPRDGNAWIGLTDGVKEGIWTWADGTPVNTTFWQAGQPNSYDGEQDCGETVQRIVGVGAWNDDGCFAEQLFVCER